jgi:hypothetical protein
VTEWSFEGTDHRGDAVPIDTVGNLTTTWTGLAVLSGNVTATYLQGGSPSPQTATGDLTVIPRPWRWSQADPNPTQERIFDEGQGQACIPFYPYTHPLPALLGYSTNIGRPCEPYAAVLQPYPFEESGHTLAQVPSSGPNAGLHYVAAGTWIIHVGSRTNPDLESTSSIRRQLGDRDRNACKKVSLPIPGHANFWEYNTLCRGIDVDAGFIQGVKNHEGLGTLGVDVPQPNGHWARFEKKAREPVGDPYHRVEHFVASDLVPLSFDVDVEAGEANDALYAFALDHTYVKDNWCGTIFIFNDSTLVYQRTRLGQQVMCP